MKKLMLLLLTLATLISSSCTVIDKTPVGSLLFTSVRKSFYCSSGAITSAIKPIERDDPNYAKSTWCRRIQLNDEQYYQEKGSFLFYLDPVGDISQYIETGYLRFYISVPQSMTLQISMNNENWTSTARYSFFIDTEKTVEGFNEIRIPFKSLLENASASFDPTKVKNINLFVPEDATAETFLSPGQQIHIMPFEFWSDKPAAADPYEYVNKFYCGSGNKIEVWDKNGILPESIVVNAYQNTLDTEQANTILQQKVPGAELQDLYTIQLINDMTRVVSVYDLTGEVEIAIPEGSISQNDSLRVMVIGQEQTKEVPTYHQDGFLIIRTDTMGDFVFFTGDGEVETTQEEVPNYLSVRIDVNHPGIPGYDAEYTFKVMEYSGGSIKLLNEKDYTLFCNIPEIKFENAKATVPAEFKDNTSIQGVKIYAQKNDNPDITGYYPLMIKNWSMTFQDEFDGTELDESKWPYAKNVWNPVSDIGQGKTMAESRDAIYVEDGKCTLRIESGEGKEVYHQGQLAGPADFVYGGMSTENAFSQHFGCFTTSVKLPVGTSAGNNAAFWLLIQDEGYATSYFFRYRNTSENRNYYCGEIDIMECSTAWNPDQYQITEHFWDKDTLEHDSDFIAYMDQNLFNGEYAEVSCVWTENALYYYYNGKVVKAVKNIEAYEDSEAYILWDFYGGGYGAENATWVGSFTEDDLDKMNISIDYVRVYQ